VEWITGRPTLFNEEGMILGKHEFLRWSRYRFLAGANPYIQQSPRSGSGCCGKRRARRQILPGEWPATSSYGCGFSDYIGGFRTHKRFPGASAISRSITEFTMKLYEIIEEELKTEPRGAKLKLFRRVSRTMQKIPKVRWFLKRLVTNSLYRMPGRDWPAAITYPVDGWKFRE
jgi:hypothetical protein